MLFLPPSYVREVLRIKITKLQESPSPSPLPSRGVVRSMRQNFCHWSPLFHAGNKFVGRKVLCNTKLLWVLPLTCEAFNSWFGFIIFAEFILFYCRRDGCVHVALWCVLLLLCVCFLGNNGALILVLDGVYAKLLFTSTTMITTTLLHHHYDPNHSAANITLTLHHRHYHSSSPSPPLCYHIHLT